MSTGAQALRRMLRRRMLDLEAQAHAAYKAYRKEEAARLYHEAQRLAETLQSPHDIVYLRFWRGSSLAGAKQYLEALAAVTPTLREMGRVGRPQDVFNTLALYISVALDIPLDYQTILEPLEYCKEYILTKGQMIWRHKLLYLEARLCYERGEFERALTLAEESWAAWRNVYPHYTADTHLDICVEYSLRTDQPDKALYYLDVWERDDHNSLPLVRNYRRRYWQAIYWRYVGDYERALLVADACVRHADLMERGDRARLMRAPIHLLRGNPALARADLGSVKLAAIRDNLLAVGDYYLARARVAAGLPPADDAFGHDFPAPTAIKDAAALRRALARAKINYRGHLRWARKWDTAFGVNWRQTELAERLERVTALAMD